MADTEVPTQDQIDTIQARTEFTINQLLRSGFEVNLGAIINDARSITLTKIVTDLLVKAEGITEEEARRIIDMKFNVEAERIIEGVKAKANREKLLHGVMNGGVPNVGPAPR